MNLFALKGEYINKINEKNYLFYFQNKEPPITLNNQVIQHDKDKNKKPLQSIQRNASEDDDENVAKKKKEKIIYVIFKKN